MFKTLVKARFSILMIFFGFMSASLLNSYEPQFNSLTSTMQFLIINVIAGVGLWLIWKDRNSI